ncbi:hypothetical protein ANN_06023 [Periplaneta americana]|uniref:Uncharacterized protein n=1 Tax=Periplaneta americana TaxID=6978 RepID=A0ABQ8TE96_PERAM|nr:hypothetical protein ANN_06023 [Periplaneta americana]
MDENAIDLHRTDGKIVIDYLSSVRWKNSNGKKKIGKKVHLNAIDLARDRTRNRGHRRPALHQLANQSTVSIVRSRNMFAFSSNERAFNIESYFRTGTEFRRGIRRRYIIFFEWRAYILYMNGFQIECCVVIQFPRSQYTDLFAGNAGARNQLFPRRKGIALPDLAIHAARVTSRTVLLAVKPPHLCPKPKPQNRFYLTPYEENSDFPNDRPEDCEKDGTYIPYTLYVYEYCSHVEEDER